MAFDATGHMAAAIPFAFDDYLELGDTTGRVIREDKRGCIPGETPQILERLHIDPGQLIATTARMLQQFRADSLRIVAQAGLGEGPAVARSRPAAMLPGVAVVC